MRGVAEDVESQSTGIVEGNAADRNVTNRSFTVRVPASTSNLGAGFDCFGLALQLYLTVRAAIAPEANDPCRVESTGEGEGELPEGADNLIFRAMNYAAEREGLTLPPVCLTVHNEVPLGRG